jgi:hypothetical protein
VDMVDSRWRVCSGPGATHVAVERIRSVEVCFMDYCDLDETYNDILHEYQPSLARLRQFRAEGLNVIVPDMDVNVIVLDNGCSCPGRGGRLSQF